MSKSSRQRCVDIRLPRMGVRARHNNGGEALWPGAIRLMRAARHFLRTKGHGNA